MRTIPGVDAGALRELFSSPDPIASVYVDVRATGEQDALARWRPIGDRLAEQGAAPATLSALTERVLGSVPGRGVLAAFAAADDVLFAVDMPGSAQPGLGMYAALPHLAPLLAWLQDHPALVAAVVDRAGADILVYPSGAAEAIGTVVTGPDDEIERNAPGGWSQPRYQRRAEDSWQHNAARVAETLVRTLRRLDAHLLLLAGDVRALQYLDEQLPTWVQHEVVVHRVSGGRSQDGSWSRRAEQIRQEARRAAEDERASLLAELAEGRGPGGHAVEGSRETLAALAAGRVRTLLLGPDAVGKRTAWFGPGPTDVATRSEPLIQAGMRVQRGPLVDVAVRAAILTGAQVRILGPVRSDRPAEGIGALCRFTT